MVVEALSVALGLAAVRGARSDTPTALQLRLLETVVEVAAEKNSAHRQHSGAD